MTITILIILGIGAASATGYYILYQLNKKITLAKSQLQDVINLKNTTETIYKDLSDKVVHSTANLEALKNELGTIQQTYNEKQAQLAAIPSEFEKAYQVENNKLSQHKKAIDQAKTSYEKTIDGAKEKYINIIDDLYNEAEKRYDTYINDLTHKYEAHKEQVQMQIDNNNAALQNIQDTLAAAQRAMLREQEKEENIEFYTVQLPPTAKNDIKLLQSIEKDLNDPRPLRMVIWTSYYSKKVNEMCSRVLPQKDVCGIYRITNISTKQCYIGQSKNIRERWREHIKCGLNIDTPAGNKLYSAMIKEGITQFTFELLIECEPQQLNELEKSYIDLYNSYELGYNSNKGISNGGCNGNSNSTRTNN